MSAAKKQRNTGTAPPGSNTTSARRRRTVWDKSNERVGCTQGQPARRASRQAGSRGRRLRLRAAVPFHAWGTAGRRWRSRSGEGVRTWATLTASAPGQPPLGGRALHRSSHKSAQLWAALAEQLDRAADGRRRHLLGLPCVQSEAPVGHRWRQAKGDGSGVGSGANG